MANESVCAKLAAGQDVSCLSPLRRYYQQAVLINKSDIDPESILITNTGLAGACAYNVEFTLKEDTTGYLFKGNENGSVYKGFFDKSNNDTFGIPEYIHHAQLIMAGVDEAAKCNLQAIDKGSVVVAYQFADNTIEIYGIENGLTTGDYTYDTQENGGATTLDLASMENNPERYMPLVYKSQTPGTEVADFDALFSNPA